MNKNIKILFLIFPLFFCNACRNQQREYNFDFEDVPIDITGFPSQWQRGVSNEKFDITTDYYTVYKGNASACLFFDGITFNNSYEILKQRIPVDTSGKELELRAFLKLDRVAKAGLVLQTEDENRNPINWDTLMYNWGYSYTIDWKEYSVKIPISKEAKYIVLGVYLFDTGIVWADDFRLYMDGKPYSYDVTLNGGE